MKEHVVVFSPLAARQLSRLHRYIVEHSGERRADGYIERIVSFCRSLRHFPHRGSRRDDLLAGLRTIGFERRATIAFVVEEQAVVIEGIYYAGQDFESHYDHE